MNDRNRLPLELKRGLTRRRFLQMSGVLGGTALAGFGGSLAWARETVKQFENDLVTPLTPWRVNTYLVRGAQPILVDTGFPYDEAAITTALIESGIPLAALSLILITHGHYDHFGSAAGLKAKSSALVAVPETEAQHLIDGESTPIQVLSTMGRILRMLPTGERPAAPVIPDVLLSPEQSLEEYGLAGRVIPTPGHTAGSITVLVDKIALIGDLLVGNLLYPNQPDYPYYIDKLDDQPQILTSLQRLLDEGVQMFFPGHGLPFDRASAIRWLDAVS